MTTIDPPLPGYTIYDPVDPFEGIAGPFFWKKLEDGTNHFVVRTSERQCNRQGAVHGGFLMTMIDLTFAATAKEYPEQRLVTISLSSEFVSSGEVGSLIEATAEVVRRTRSFCFLRGQVTSGGITLLNSSSIYRMYR
ncbi:MAG: PaaI family thioesterase [Alphaproteobacteria bacterium]|nr:PaaI family thioesterase [Alphaproteobacteria bacterium]